MSVLDGPGEGTWSVFAAKVVEERDELRHKLAGEAAHIKSLEGLLVDAVRERDEARAALARTDRARRDSENAWEEEYDAMKRERDEARADFDSLEDDAVKVVLAYRNGDKIELDEAVESLASNGRPQWWEKSKPIGLRGESDD